VLDATAETFPDKAKFWVEQDSLQYGDTLEGSKPLQAVNYMLFRIECRDNRNDWDELRSISDPYKEVLKSLQAGQVEAAQVHLKSAIQAALTAPELTKNVDRRRVVEQLKLKFNQDKADLGAGAFKRSDGSLNTLMKQAGPVTDAAAKPELKAKEAFEGL